MEHLMEHLEWKGKSGMQELNLFFSVAPLKYCTKK